MKHVAYILIFELDPVRSHANHTKDSLSLSVSDLYTYAYIYIFLIIHARVFNPLSLFYFFVYAVF